MKTLTLFTLLTSMWQSPVIALLIIVALVLIADLLNQYIESKKIICLDMNFSDWSYKDLQAYAKLHGIKANSKRALLINQLQALLPSSEEEQEV